MAFIVIWTQMAEDGLSALSPDEARRVIENIENIKEDPFRHVKRMKGYHLFIRRVVKYRVLLDIQNGEMKILVLKVGKRSNVYDENRMHF